MDVVAVLVLQSIHKRSKIKITAIRGRLFPFPVTITGMIVALVSNERQHRSEAYVVIAAIRLVLAFDLHQQQP